MNIFGLDFRVNGGKLGVQTPARLLRGRGKESELQPEHLATCEPLVLLVHGFNVSREDAIRQLHRFAELLQMNGVTEPTIVWITWPGDGFGGALCYPTQEPEADATADHLAKLLIERVRPRQPVSFVAHSLGSRVVLRTLTLLAGSAVQVGEVVLMAAAVDGDSPARPKRYRKGVEHARRVTVLHSEKDTVLRFAFPPGDVVASVLYGGKTSSALGFHGPRPAREGQAVPDNITALPAKDANHGDYLPGDAPNPKQERAAKLCSGFLRGE